MDRYQEGQRDILEKVEKYLLDTIEEWNRLGDRKYELPNIQVYNHIRKCLDGLEKLEKRTYAGKWIANNICSICKKSVKGYAIQQKFYYCPNCGAKMGGTFEESVYEQTFCE